VLRQAHLITVVGTFLIGCSVLLVVGCAATRSESSKQQGHTEATREQTRSAKAASEEARCAETQLIDHHRPSVIPSPGRSDEDWVTNNVPGCPKGGPLLGTDSADKLDGGEGDDEIRGLGAKDDLIGGSGSDTIYGGPGKDWLRGAPWEGGDPVLSKDVLYGGPGNDDLENGAGYDVLYGGDGHDILHAGKGDNVLYGGDANDFLYAGPGANVLYGGDGNDVLVADRSGQRDKLYCGEGKDRYLANNKDYVDSSCEKHVGGGSA
jgi:hypothetical protein